MVCAFLMLVGQWLVLGFEDRPMKADPQELIDRIRKDPYLNRDEKSQLVDSLRKTKHYGLVWKKKPEEVEENQRNRIPVLTEVRERAIVSEAADAPNHILIEGDNLDALVALTYTHEGKIDVIYIDPPYNTGNKDFIYNDCFVDKESPYRHSLWLSFMSRRLKIAKCLLSDKGVIFISIDDNEQAQLKLLCDEIFGEWNFVGMLPRVTKKSGKAHSDDIARNHDNILIYTKASEQELQGISYSEQGFDNEDEYVEERGRYKLNQTIDYDSLWYNPAMDYELVVDSVKYYAGGSYDSWCNRHRGVHNPKDWVWRWSRAKFDFGFANGFVVIKKSKNGVRLYSKTYLNASIEKDDRGNYYIEYRTRTNKVSSLTFVDNEYSNDNAKKELGRIMDANSFDFPKPTSLIKTLIKLSPSKNPTILDFFAGSGTTLHATMALNAEDGGHRQCILVTNNENRICEDVTYVRNKKVIEGYVNAKGETVKGLTANSLRYYKTDFIDRDKTAQNRRALAAASADLLCIREDSYNELDHFGSLKLKPSVARYFTGNGKHILLILNENAIEYFVKEIKDSDSPAKFKVYVFSPGDYAYDDEFTDVADRVELCAVPSSVYNAYEKVLPKRVRDVDEEESDDFAENGGDGFLGDARNFEDQGEEKPGQNENDVEE